MTKNMGTIDRALRLTIAVALAIAAFTVPALAGGAWHWVALAVAGIFLLTSSVSFCPLYRLIGLQTCKEC